MIAHAFSHLQFCLLTLALLSLLPLSGLVICPSLQYRRVGLLCSGLALNHPVNGARPGFLPKWLKLTVIKGQGRQDTSFYFYPTDEEG
jgi:hypothetical protein